MLYSKPVLCRAAQVEEEPVAEHIEQLKDAQDGVFTACWSWSTQEPYREFDGKPDQGTVQEEAAICKWFDPWHARLWRRMSTSTCLLFNMRCLGNSYSVHVQSGRGCGEPRGQASVCSSSPGACRSTVHVR